MRTRALALAAVLAARSALADATITVDAFNSDWSMTQSCITDPLGDGSNGIDITRACLENDNASGNTGYLYALFEALPGFGSAIDRYFGFAYDRNNDGVITQTGDEVWAVHFNRNTATPDRLTVYQPTTFTVLRTYTMTNDCGGSGSANGWSGAQRNLPTGNPRGIVEMRIAYGCLGLTAGTDNRLFQLGVYPNFDVLTPSYYDGAGGTVTPQGVPPDPIGFTITSGFQQNRLFWTNPAAHQGTLVLRATGSPPNTAPTIHVTYTVGQTLGNATVRYVDDNGSTVNGFTDTGLTNGTRYYYKVYNHHQHETYSPGVLPTSQGLFAEPTAQTGGSPLWCYSGGFPTLQQPTTELGQRVFSASNGRTITANLTQPGPQDGWEAWRPAQLDGGVQSRPTLVPLFGRTGNFLITADQSGRAYLIRASDGAIMWTTADLADVIQGQPVVQLYQYANAAFQAAHPNRDAIFIATRNNSTNNNKVYAVSSVNGAVLWTYPSTNSMDIVSGGMAVDYANNRLWVASRGNPSLRVVSTLNGAQVATFNLGPIDNGVNLRFVGGVATEAVTINNTGTVYGINLTTLTQRWSRSTGANPTAWVFPLNTGFIASVVGGLQRWDVLADAGTTQIWNATVPGANGITIDYTSQQLYVGGTASTLRQLNLSDGGTTRALTMPGTATSFGHPTLDTTAARIHVGTLDGRLCAFPAPLP